MIKKFSYRHIDWIDLETPTDQDVSDLKSRHSIHPLILEDLISPTRKPRVDFFDNHVYLVLHLPVYDSESKEVLIREIDFIVSKHYIITAHYMEISELHQFSKIFASENLLEQHDQKIHAGYVFFYIMRHLYSSLEDELHIINKRLEDVEEKIFSGDEHQMVLDLSIVGRNLLDFRRAIKTHSEILSSFDNASQKIFGEDFSFYSRSILNEYHKISNLAESTKENFRELRETNDSLLSTKTNDIMKFLTIMAFATFPLTLIAGIFGMNTMNTPIIGNINDFWIIIGVMFTLTLTFFVWFKYKRWL